MNCSHYCVQACGHMGECTQCPQIISKTIAECQHQINFRCDKQPDKSDCDKTCDKKLKCGHFCKQKCAILNCQCSAPIEIESPCKHKSKLTIKCSEKDDIWKLQLKCNNICNELLKCCHKCLNKCSDCFGGYIHGKCLEKCDRFLYCEHKCQYPCSNNCIPCKMRCENWCQHSGCKNECSEPCVPCLEDCALKCKHQKCLKKCGELCETV